MQQVADYFNALNRDYLAVHQAKEELFWQLYMGTGNDDVSERFSAAESAYKRFISQPQRLAELRTHLATLENSPRDEQQQALSHGLQGWYRFFDCNVIEDPQAQALMDEIITAESALYAKRKSYEMTHLDAKGERVSASLGELLTNQTTNDTEAYRQSSQQALRDLEQWLLQNGFPELISLRNRFARQMGYRNYFDYKVNKTERMTPEQLFAILDPFEEQTREANTRSLKNLADEKGEEALQPWNIRYASAGDVTRQLDPYFPFSASLERWINSFKRLRIGFNGAEMQLDLLVRKGKYENGFMHGPVPPFVQEGNWVPARINFTSLAKPDQIGSGASGINTLFHEGGHAAHFANIRQNAPCFSQEFPPTSMAYAETQSMFCDSLLGDADWLKRYAKNAQGETIPDELIRADISTQQPMRAFSERHILLVPYFEWQLYSWDDEARTPEAMTKLARDTEQRILGISGSPRPTLAIPHLLSMESACSYQGYLLALMAVEQTRSYFLQRDGYLTDNPAIGPDLAQHYWHPGNSVSHDDTLRSLTGEGFNPAYLAQACNLTVDEAWQQAEGMMAKAAGRPQPAADFDLSARIRVVDGSRVLADNEQSDEKMCQDFAAFIEREYPRSQA
ncbi:M3 family metallopeptidase [Pectobacterium brasiliense]|uniref:M3 family metallopeptidase n=1 Tax=Pectobacterium brasiliense TaxID=180957 RepID=UPI0001A4401B|nr:M3 family metallopeptidase [Pectobacterium brasiliense]KGA24558.1 peptidase M3 [Pectobacterium brasiliense]KRF66954.1 peptidase M3 [Pectobacterium brasiliense]MBN3184566.1 peptidase M3 [Pectobacterium brasiliense]MCA5919011.1 M3 family metallopeptidase [Pectobacterium brasiliense]MCA5925456.1 M3 family metallopeptidase [Pectobacterium brasiliense]